MFINSFSGTRPHSRICTRLVCLRRSSRAERRDRDRVSPKRKYLLSSPSQRTSANPWSRVRFPGSPGHAPPCPRVWLTKHKGEWKTDRTQKQLNLPCQRFSLRILTPLPFRVTSLWETSGQDPGIQTPPPQTSSLAFILRDWGALCNFI